MSLKQACLHQLFLTITFPKQNHFMKIKTITYIHAFNVTGFLNDKIGYEAEVDEGESPDEVALTLIAKAKSVAAKVQSDFNQSHEFIDKNTPLPVETISKENRRVASLEDDIMASQDLKTLESFKLLADTIPEMQIAYLKRKYQLEHGTV